MEKHSLRSCIPLIMLTGAGLLFGLSFLLCRLPQHKRFFYRGGAITVRSWHDLFSVCMGILAAAVVLCAVIGTVRFLAAKQRRKAAPKPHPLLLWLCALPALLLIFLSEIHVTGLWSRSDYEPECYAFTDGTRTVVIEEISFLLMGRGNVYQAFADGTAIPLGEFSTDDGGRNFGDYRIRWEPDSVEITYHTFVTNDSADTVCFPLSS